jgi:caffeoyl-CoA O-methyltransferase
VTPRTRSRFVEGAIATYASAHSTGPDQVQLDLQAVTADKTGRWVVMQIGDDQAVFMEMLARAIGAQSAVEVGTFTGYSALAVARGIGPSGRLLCLDVSEEWTSIAREFWGRAGVADRIELKIGPASESLRALTTEEQFDFAFVDADKTGYADYYEQLLPRMRRGGLILADNTLRDGNVLKDDDPGDPDTAAIKRFNDALMQDDRVKVVLLPIGDGVTMIQKL